MSLAGFLRLVRRIPGLYPLLVFVFARRITVRGISMYPALRPGERILFDQLAYHLEEPRVGEVVLARHPARPGVRFIKRVANPPADVRLEAGEYWLLGDNADGSTDSRQLGPFRREHITARAWLVYWPPERVRRIQPS